MTSSRRKNSSPPPTPKQNKNISFLSISLSGASLTCASIRASLNLKRRIEEKNIRITSLGITPGFRVTVASELKSHIFREAGTLTRLFSIVRFEKNSIPVFGNSSRLGFLKITRLLKYLNLEKTMTQEKYENINRFEKFKKLTNTIRRKKFP